MLSPAFAKAQHPTHWTRTQHHPSPRCHQRSRKPALPVSFVTGVCESLEANGLKPMPPTLQYLISLPSSSHHVFLKEYTIHISELFLHTSNLHWCWTCILLRRPYDFQASTFFIRWVCPCCHCPRLVVWVGRCYSQGCHSSALQR